MIDFANVRKTFIPEGEVETITHGASVLWKKYRLIPKEYQQVEYVENFGYEYINTQFTPNKNTRVDVVAMVMSAESAALNDGFIPYGAGEGYASNAFECYSSKGQYEFNYNNQYLYLGTVINGDVVTISQNKNVVTLSSPTQGTLSLTHEYGDFTVPRPMTLFAIHRSPTLYIGRQKIYSCQIYDNGTLIRNFVPCYLKSTGEVGMYDTVYGVFYKNAGTGAFGKGADISA